MKNVLLLGSMKDKQTGWYVAYSFKELGYRIDAVDVREILFREGGTLAQKRILAEIDKFEQEFDIVLIFKGLELHPKTVKTIKEKFPKAKLVNWFFDKYLADKPIWEQQFFHESLKLYDYFFCSLKGVADKLKEIGFDNARYLDEGCYPPWNGEVHINNFQKKKYGADISFMGSLGFLAQHLNRVEILYSIAEEGYDLKVWGNIACDWKLIPPLLKTMHTEKNAVNDTHSMVVQSSLINLGIDADPSIELGHSARLYRVLCAGGLYLTTYCKGMEKMFKINERDKPITGKEELVVYYDMKDLPKILDFLLAKPKIRDEIRLRGQKSVLKNHTFTLRVKNMLEVIK